MCILAELFSFKAVLPYLIGIGIIAMFIGFFIDRKKNSQRTNEEYESDYIYTNDVTKMMVGIRALYKRGADINKYRSLVLPLLVEQRSSDRVAGKMILKSCYPEDFELIKGFRGSKQLEVCREKVKPLFEKYGLN